VQVDRPLADPGPFGDILDRDPLVPPAEHELGGRIQDPLGSLCGSSRCHRPP
jgi:hypothetical protein